MFSRLKHQLSIFAPLGAGLLVITLLTALGGLWQYQHELADQTSVKPVTGTAGFTAAYQSPDKAGSNVQAGSGNGQRQSATSANSTGLRTITGSRSKAGSTTSNSTANGQPANASPTAIALDLSVNGQPKGPVRLTAGSNQCDVLSQALAEGVISSLDMRYSSQYKTEAVYVINGIGDPDAVWWTYKVNGSAPPYGCGLMAAHNGDSVNWQYVKT